MIKERGLSWPPLTGGCPAERAFTMIEIAISLAVIAFALLAILGSLPIGLEVQQKNRDETIINQDASVWLDAIRNGARGVDDLTNYVIAIHVHTTPFTISRGGRPLAGATITRSFTNNFLINGQRVIGLLTTPKYTPGPQGGFSSNYVFAIVRALSGAAFEKMPQDNQLVRDTAFTYRMTSEIVPYAYYNPEWFDLTTVPPGSPEFYSRSNSFIISQTLRTNLSDLRLIFRWPYVPPKGVVSNNKLVFRTVAGGRIWTTNDAPQVGNSPNLYFIEPGSYVKAL